MHRLLGVAVALSTCCLASDPGPPTGHAVNRTYDDGYVLVDSTGNSFGLTWNWGYLDTSQYFAASDTYHFHTIQITGGVATVLTDIYAAEGVFAPAPYSGSFLGPGPTIPDEPISRSIQTFAVPSIRVTGSGTNIVVTSIGSTNVLLEKVSSLGTNALVAGWSRLTNAPVVSSDRAVFTLPASESHVFYRTRLVLP